jgi:hypothetical protein
MAVMIWEIPVFFWDMLIVLNWITGQNHGVYKWHVYTTRKNTGMGGMMTLRFVSMDIALIAKWKQLVMLNKAFAPFVVSVFMALKI